MAPHGNIILLDPKPLPACFFRGTVTVHSAGGEAISGLPFRHPRGLPPPLREAQAHGEERQGRHVQLLDLHHGQLCR